MGRGWLFHGSDMWEKETPKGEEPTRYGAKGRTLKVLGKGGWGEYFKDKKRREEMERGTLKMDRQKKTGKTLKIRIYGKRKKIKRNRKKKC